MLRAAATALALTAALAVAACGSSSDEAEVKGTVKDFVSASNERDFEKFCELLSTDTKKKVEAQTGGTKCQEGLEQAAGSTPGNTEAEVTKVSIAKGGKTATATTRLKQKGQEQAAGEQQLQLVKEGGDWKIAFETPGAPGGPQGGQSTTPDSGGKKRK